MGTFGSEVRAEYTAIGPAVSLAEKLAQAAAPDSVTLTAAFAQGLPRSALRSCGQLMLQGEQEALRLVALRCASVADLEAASLPEVS